MFKRHGRGMTDQPGGTAIHILLGLAVCAFSSRSGAGDLKEFRVYDNGGTYHVTMVMGVHAPLGYVRAVLTDFEHIYRLNPSITESEILPSPLPGVTRVRTRVRGCILFFCKEIERVEDVRTLETGDLQAEIVPELSDIRSGMAKWKTRKTGDDTQVTYTGYMEPDFFVPPIIGSYFLKQGFGREIKISFERLECDAQTRALLDRPHGVQRAAYGNDAVACSGECVDDGTACPQ